MRSRPLGTELSAAEAAVVARFDAAPDAEESLRERVAVAMYDQTEQAEYREWPDITEDQQGFFVILADAAIAVMRGDDA